MFANAVLITAGMLYLILGFPVVLVVEGAILWLFNRENTLAEIATAVVLMNAASTALSYGLSPYLPLGTEAAIDDFSSRIYYTTAPGWWWRLSIGTFLPAFVLSVLVEAGVLFVLRSRCNVQRIFVPVTVANVAAYVLLLAVAIIIG